MRSLNVVNWKLRHFEVCVLYHLVITHSFTGEGLPRCVGHKHPIRAKTGCDTSGKHVINIGL